MSQSFERISVDPEVMGGVACIAGTRIPVSTVVAMAGAGMSVSEIIDAHPQLRPDDVAQALAFSRREQGRR